MDEQVFAEPTGDTAGIDADALYDQIEQTGEAHSANIPMEAEKAAEPAAAPAAAQEIEFTWNGKPIKAPLDKAVQWAQQGYDYSQKMAEFNKQRQEYDARLAEYDSKYKPIDEYVRQNPEFWDHVTQSWQQRQQSANSQLDPNNPIAQKLTTLESKLTEFEKFKQAEESKRIAEQREAEDRQLADEIKSIRETYKEINLDSVGEDGASLESRVIKHAIDNGIKSFKTAFRDLLHEDLLKKAEERGKELVAKEHQKRTKLGLLGKTPAPTKGIKPAEDVKNKSYDALFQEALAELGA